MERGICEECSLENTGVNDSSNPDKLLREDEKEYEIFKQIKEVEELEKKCPSYDSVKSDPLEYVTHPQAIYTSRFI
ncbi:9880_t:CDS:2, partial [Acaulospora colombiana]